ncbi:MAG: hypothetical protein HYZ94_00300, partial [Candidatus Omnitrophica bacterium]|nr:hypothetical protein [Candidatus Omnitrophota bacterium]
GKPINLKKAQFLAPWDMRHVLDKAEHAGNRQILVTERGASFGYNTLVSDLRSLQVLAGFGYPVIYDGTHSVQMPGGLGKASGGSREFVPAGRPPPGDQGDPPDAEQAVLMSERRITPQNHRIATETQRISSTFCVSVEFLCHLWCHGRVYKG